MSKSGRKSRKRQDNVSETKVASGGIESAATSTAPAQHQWSKSLRTIASLLIAFHLLAVFVAPFSGPPPSSIFARATGDLFSPYLRLMFIYHGYRFFAPNPGASHLVRYELDVAGETQSKTFPDRQEHWPRLLYHRHFMLSETIFSLHSSLPTHEDFLVQQFELENEITRLRNEGHSTMANRLETARVVDKQNYERMDRQQILLVVSIADQQKEKSGADEVRIHLAERQIPLPAAIEEALEDRANGTEPAETRELPILLIDSSRWIENQLYPPQANREPLPAQSSVGPMFQVPRSLPAPSVNRSSEKESGANEASENESGNNQSPDTDTDDHHSDKPSTTATDVGDEDAGDVVAGDVVAGEVDRGTEQ